MVRRRYRDDSEDLGVLLLTDDQVARVLWTSDNVSDASRDALLANPDVVQVAESDQAFAFGTRYMVTEEGGRSVSMLAQVSPLPGTDWAVVVQKPEAAAFAAVDEMVGNALLATVLLVALALALAALAARWVSRPIQRFTETSHEIAEGNFGRRVEVSGLAVELADLARDFNRMSAHVESYVARLQRAAEVNRDLFIGSIRAFAAAIDAKDPYTRGHSERVASLARTIARHLQLPDADQQKVWIGALLHDVGKLGVEDRVLRKIGQLTDEEYEQMKAHTVIGAEIIRSIEPLREMVPTIRWHHEAWNGRGYPDGKRGEEIPLPARIVAVADTFDAVTTNRPYQKAHSMEEALAIVTRLTGTRFDAKVVTAFLRAYEGGEVRLPDPGPEPEKVASGLSDAVPAAF
jgi:putative nucleotidyltransferase with HDIG domain